MEIVAGAQVTPNVRLLRLLSEGGMGSVWIAHHAGLDSEVAVKFLLGEHADRPALRSRFAQEAAAASKVKSAHVVKVYDYGVTDSNVPYLVMELLEGQDLRALLESVGRLSPEETIEIVTQLCRALDRAHAAQIVHRDIKPENVFLCVEGGARFVKLLDFGIAKSERRIGGDPRQSTMAGETLGTPFYMSPEQFRDATAIDFMADLWAIGVMTYEALTDALPFVAETLGGLAIVVNDATPLPPSHYLASVPPAFDAWFATACSREPSRRFASARELADALKAAFNETNTTEWSSRTVAVDAGSERAVVGARLSTNDQDLSLRETAFSGALALHHHSDHPRVPQSLRSWRSRPSASRFSSRSELQLVRPSSALRRPSVHHAIGVRGGSARHAARPASIDHRRCDTERERTTSSTIDQRHHAHREASHHELGKETR